MPKIDTLGALDDEMTSILNTLWRHSDDNPTPTISYLSACVKESHKYLMIGRQLFNENDLKNAKN